MNIDKLRIRLPLNVFCNVTDGKVFAGMKYDMPARCIDLHDTYARLTKSMWPYDADSVRVPFMDSEGEELGGCVLVLYGGSISLSLDTNRLTSEQEKLILERIDKGTDIFAILADVEIDEAKEGEYPEVEKATLTSCFIDAPKLSTMNEIISKRNAAKKAKTTWMAKLSGIAVKDKGEVSKNE